MTAPSWHGWGHEGTTLSIAPSPTDGRAIALILTVDGEHEEVAHFSCEAAAEDTMAFLDGALRVQAEANTALLGRHDGG